MASSGKVVLNEPPLEGTRGKKQPSCTRKLSCLTEELKTIFILTFVIFLELAAFGPIQSLQSSLNSEGGLGSLSLACLYGPYFIFAMSAPAIVRVITPKGCIISAFIADAFYIGANFHPTWLTLIPTSALTGALTGPLWTAKDLYVSQLARQSLKPSTVNFKERYQSKLSFYNGIVFAGQSLSQVLGQIISSTILMQSSNPKDSTLCGSLHCQNDIFLKLNSTNQTNVVSSRPEKTFVYTLLGIFLSFILLAILLVVLFLHPIPSGNQDHSITSAFVSCARRTADRKILLMIPQVVMFGFYQAIFQADYTKSYITCGAGIGMVGYAMMCRGVTSALSSIISGRLVKYTGRQIQVTCSLLGYIGVTVMLWVWIPSQDEIPLFFVVPAVFGFSDVVFQTHICTILALMFEDNSASAFANWYTFRALSKAISFVLSGFVCVWIKLSLASAFLISAITAFIILELLLRFGKTPLKDSVVTEAMLKSRKIDDILDEGT